MTTITLQKINNTHSRIVSDDAGAIRTLRDHFTFTVPNAHFRMKNAKFGNWDGKIRLLKPNGSIYGGLKAEIEKTCHHKGWEFRCEYQTHWDNPTYDEVRTFSEGLELTAGGDSIEARDYQLAYVVAALQDRRRIMLCPTSGGKSLMAYLIIRWALERMGLKRCLLIVPTVNLVNQMATDFVDYGWDMENIHQIYDGAEKHAECPVTISTWQSISKETDYLHRFDFVIGDECHGYQAKSLVHIMENLINAQMRIGMSGTLDGLTTSRMVLEGLFGEVQRVVKTTDLMEQGYSAQLKIKGLVLGYSSAVREEVAKMNLDFDGEKKFIYQNKKRNTFVTKLALGLPGNTMIFFQHEVQGRTLYDMLKEMNTDPDRRVYYIDGSVGVPEREKIRAEFETHDKITLVVSFGTTNLGANYKSVHNIIFGSAYKTIIKTLQTIGRGLRLSATKHTCTLYDIADNMSWGTGKKVRDNYIMRHFKERLQIYTDEGFVFKTIEIDL